MENWTQFILYKKNILYNLNQIKKNTTSKICAMIKADAYGYGMINVAKILDNKVDFFGVANGVEALYLKNNNIKTKILVCGILKESLLKEIIINKISFACNNIHFLKKIVKISKELKIQALVHIKVNSGMNRLGEKNIDNLSKMVEYIKKQKFVKLEGIFTHSGFSECENKENLNLQHKKFIKMVKKLNLPKDTIVHFANSGAFCYDNSFHHDMVRIGKLLYGVNANFSNNLLDLKPVFALKSCIIQRQFVKKGEYIGYGENLKAKTNLYVGVIPIGYGDGFLSYYKGANVIIKNKKYEILSVCMDLTIIKIDENIKEKDKVLILGLSNQNCIPVTDFSNQSHKVASQVVANLNKNRFDIVVI